MTIFFIQKQKKSSKCDSKKTVSPSTAEKSPDVTAYPVIA